MDVLTALKMALDRDVPKKKGAVKWKTLFEEDREGNQLAFVETLRDQHLSDREMYLEELEEAICAYDPENDGGFSEFESELHCSEPICFSLHGCPPENRLGQSARDQTCIQAHRPREDRRGSSAAHEKGFTDY